MDNLSRCVLNAYSIGQFVYVGQPTHHHACKQVWYFLFKIPRANATATATQNKGGRVGAVFRQQPAESATAHTAGLHAAPLATLCNAYAQNALKLGCRPILSNTLNPTA